MYIKQSLSNMEFMKTCPYPNIFFLPPTQFFSLKKNKCITVHQSKYYCYILHKNTVTSISTFPPSSNPIGFIFKVYLNPLQLHGHHSNPIHHLFFSRLL